MKVLFAVSNDKMSETIIKQYEKQYKEIINYKNVYYFNAILKELQRDKTYDRIVISEDLEQYASSDHEQMDNFIFGRLDSISDEASNVKGEDIPIILICEERRVKGEELLVKLFGIGIYNAIIGADRSINEVCRLINRPRSKKEAKIYYKIDSEDVLYEKNDENEVSELEIQNILAHYKKIGNDEQKIVDSFDSIASQYNNIQLKIICKFLPLNVRAVLEERSSRYLDIFAYDGISNSVRVNNKEEKQLKKYQTMKKKQEEETKGTSEIMLKSNENTLREPVVIPSAMSSNTKKVIKTVDPVIPEIKEESEFEPIYNTEEEMPEESNNTNEEIINKIEEDKVETPVQPVKRGRGRPKKIVTEQPQVEQVPKRKRGRPRKNEVVEEESVLPGFSEEKLSNTVAEEENESILPGFSDLEQNNTTKIEPEEEDETTLPGFAEEEETEDEYNSILPGFGQEENEETEIYSKPENTVVPQYKEDSENVSSVNNVIEENYQIPNMRPKVPQYEELDMNRILAPNQKIVAFVGTSKNGTSFLVNNVAEILSLNNVNTAILDLTKNRNAYYIYTKNEEMLRNKANECIKKLKDGVADGIEIHKNLTVYTSAFDVEEIENVEPIIQTLLTKHNMVLLDCDFDTPDRYFKYSKEIYLVQSMDILTIQPLTLFLRKLSDKGAFSEEKARVVLNKYIKTKELNEDILVGGISIYNDASMTVRKELFNRKTVKRITIPFETETYLRYLNGLVICDVSLKGYSKKILQSLKQLATSVYSTSNSSNGGKYTPPSVKNTTFSSSMNSTLEQMSKRY
ncbi:MAG TPA: hypothetical protein DIU30_00460 [Clostridiales bacterium]|jgi:hypothetical protein|nr:unknown [Clostridium sp. CAG:269]HCQ54807.1 hypothetical protein [Clostridiales bacterium]